MKQRITWIIPEDLDNIVKSCKRDKTGNLLVPETLEIYQKPTKAEILQAEITRLETELASMEVPTDAELIEEGKMIHPYYHIIEQLEYHKKQL